MNTRHLLPAFALLATAVHAAPAAKPADPAAEAKLRDALRATTLQLRTAQNDLATAQAGLETTTKSLETLKKQTAAAAAAHAAELARNAKQLAEMNAKDAKQAERIKALEEASSSWKTEALRVTEIAKSTEAERARLAALADRLALRVADREAKNVELVRLGNDILDHYENFALGKAIANREPFIGFARVDLQTQVQDYADKITDQKVKPGTPAPGEKPAPAATTTAAK